MSDRGSTGSRRRLSQVVVAAASGCFATGGIIAVAGPGLAETGCPHAVFDTVASASGASVVVDEPGLSPVSQADVGSPTAQAQVGSLDGSTAFAGAPYSDAGAGNLGLVGAVGPNDVPVFAVSSFPLEPEVVKESPAWRIEARSGAQTASAGVGGTPSPAASSTDAPSGAVTAAAAAACGDDGTLESVADNRVEGLEIAGVLRIGSISSHARVVRAPDGEPALEGTMAVEGATVLGQPVAVTEDGLVLGAAVLPLGDNPLSAALAEAGIGVRYLDVVEDVEGGQVLAPGLEITVTRRVDGVGSRPITTTYTLGRAFALASLRGRPLPTAPPTTVSAAPPTSAALGPPPAVRTAPSAEAAVPALPPAVQPAPAPVRPSSSRLVSASLASVYPALAGGALVFVGAWFIFEQWGVKLRWT